jgi:hypothetical protein
VPALPRPVALLGAATRASVVVVILGVLLGVDPWKCGTSLADMDLEGHAGGRDETHARLMLKGPGFQRINDAVAKFGKLPPSGQL